MKEGWHCGDCEEEIMVEVTEHGGLTAHCCFYCGSLVRIFTKNMSVAFRTDKKWYIE